jgi:hypothetical protein
LEASLPKRGLNRRCYRRAGGVELPKSMDGRTVIARRYKALVEHYGTILDDERPSAADASLIRRCAPQALELEQMDLDRLAGKSVDMDVYVRLSGELRRGEATLGRLAEVI